MKSIILYGSSVRLTNAHKPVTCCGQPPYFVRAKVFNGDTVNALDTAHNEVMPGEFVLNTVVVPEPPTRQSQCRLPIRRPQ